ncbi:ABC transporter substrate-binding protein [Methanothermococcus sp. SCGC AD-155-C09]|nr:ABC transporter substrate-binding protein [Methanothermococcus sp. SCGC AD-155-C09]
MNLKKLVSLLLCSALIITVSLSGCTSKSVESNENINTQTTGNTVTNKNTQTTENTASTEDKVSTKENNEYITVKDMWDREVKIKKDVNRVLLLDFTGAYLEIMKIWDIDDKIVGVDSSQKKNAFLKVICPRIDNITGVGRTWEGLNYEAIAAKNPDVVIIRAYTTSKEDDEDYQKIIDRLNEMGIPVVLLLHPTSYDNPNINTMWQEIEIMGKIFNKEKEAKDLIDYLDGYVQLIRNRTKDIPEDERPRVLLYGTPDYMLGTQTIQSYFLEEIVHGKNILESGRWIKTSPEEILRLNPDVIIALGHGGYISPEDICTGKNNFINWKLVQNAKAIKEGKVGSLGITEWWPSIECPIGLLREAKTLYPEKFADIDPDEEEIKLYRDIYGMSDEEVKEAVKAQRAIGETH